MTRLNNASWSLTLLTLTLLLLASSPGAAAPDPTSPAIVSLTVTTPEGRTWSERLELLVIEEGRLTAAQEASTPADEDSNALSQLGEEISSSDATRYSDVTRIRGTKRRDCSVTDAPARPVEGWPAALLLALAAAVTTVHRRR